MTRSTEQPSVEDVILRLEAAPQGCRELDAEIHVAITPGRILHDDLHAGYTMADLGNNQRNTRLARAPYITTNRCPVAHYTESLNAAMKLLPPGMEYTISTLYGIADVEVGLNTDDPQTCRREDGNVIIAFCIAALKARQSRA